MKRWQYVLAGTVWFGLVFLLSLRLTFPSDAVVQRLAYEVQQRSDGDYALEADSAAPWWVGLALKGVRLYEVDKRKPDADAKLAFAAESARLRVGLAGLLRMTPRITGAVDLGGGEIDLELGLETNRRGTEIKVTDAIMEANDFPVIDVAPMLGMAVEGDGGIDLEVDLEAPEGLRKAEGEAKITGSNMVLTKFELPGMEGMDLGMEINIEELDLQVRMTEGRAKIERGRLLSDLANVDIDGDMVMRDELMRSSMNVQLVVSLGEQLQAFKGFMKDAEWNDGRFHYRCTGTFQRMSCRADRERSSSRSRTTSTPSPVSRATARPTTSGTTAGGGSPTTTIDDEERARRKEDIRERLRKRREAQEANAVRPEEAEEIYDDEEGEDDGFDDLFEEDDWFNEGNDLDWDDLFEEE